jgi:hypothetical protein
VLHAQMSRTPQLFRKEVAIGQQQFSYRSITVPHELGLKEASLLLGIGNCPIAGGHAFGAIEMHDDRDQ